MSYKKTVPFYKHKLYILVYQIININLVIKQNKIITSNGDCIAKVSIEG